MRVSDVIYPRNQYRSLGLEFQRSSGPETGRNKPKQIDLLCSSRLSGEIEYPNLPAIP